METSKLRIAIISEDKCKPKKCRHECRKSCPVVRTGKICIIVESVSRTAQISEGLCIGCGICVKKCPFGAITIVNLPKDIEEQTSHRFGLNAFKLHRLPIPRLGQVLGLIGTNGIGKSTALAILSGKLKPNLGQFTEPPEWKKILSHYRGSELQNYFTKILEGGLRPSLKPQWVDLLARKSTKTVLEIIVARAKEDEEATAAEKDKSGKKAQKAAEIRKREEELLAKMVTYRADLEKPKFDLQERLDTIVRTERVKLSEKAQATLATLKPFVLNMIEKLELLHLVERNVCDLSGGELQRFSILVASMCMRSNVIMYDEPSSYLDIKQRISVAKLIRSLLKHDNYIICVEHDLSVSDYLSDNICCLWGSASAYGVVTTPFGVKEGINLYLEGYIPTENLRFRDETISFKITQDVDDSKITRESTRFYPNMIKTLGQPGSNFELFIEKGSFADSEIIVLLGQNGTGKTTFIRILAGYLAAEPAGQRTAESQLKRAEAIISGKPLPEELPDEDYVEEYPDGTRVEVDSATGCRVVRLPQLTCSYKPQKIPAKFEGTVEQLLLSKIKDSYLHPQFNSDVLKPLNIEKLKNLQVLNLSGGELQRVALVITLGKPADLYLLDEPSAYLDCEQRIEASRVIKRFILHAKKSAFIVEHDFIMATYLADKVIVYEGSPGRNCIARSPQPLVSGMNRFLSLIDTTFRRDPTNYRPRINKAESVKDKEQKLSGNYFVTDFD